MSAQFDGITCPTCGASETRRMTRLDYRSGSQLPDSIELYGCTTCDSGFTLPRDAQRYDAYYREMQNDVLVDFVQTPDSMVRYGQQADALAPVLDSSRPLRVIDFGCGQGGLLRHLAERFPQHVYFGLEPCTTISKIGDITLVDDVAKLDGVFDLAIFSHVFEHLVDFSSVDTLIEHLAPNGSLYIEVPNPNAYGANPQREYLYYVDRLHVTHYSPKSLARLVERWDMNIAVYGEFAFPYKGGRAYPAQYAVASRTSTPARVADGTPTLDRFDAYLHDEARRFASLGETLASTDSVVVYGYGDNFHRARSAHGPLAGVEIKAIVDRRWEQLNRDSVGAHRFLSIEDAIREHSDTPFVVTVSWGGESIAEDIRSKTGGHVYLL